VTDISYQRLGFWAGSLAGLVALICCAAFLGPFIHWDSQGSWSELHSLIDSIALIVIAMPFVVFVGVPEVALLWHRRIACAVDMLLVVVPTTVVAYILFTAAELAAVKCLGSCG